jgi:hypothetical protein
VIGAGATQVAGRAHAKALARPVEVRFLVDHGVFSVPSYSRPGAAYQVVPEVRQDGERLVWFSCSCPAGLHGEELPVPCWHAAAAARKLLELLPAAAYLGLTGFIYPRDEARS